MGVKPASGNGGLILFSK